MFMSSLHSSFDLKEQKRPPSPCEKNEFISWFNILTGGSRDRNGFLCLLTGGTGDSAEITSHALTVQPLTTSKSMGHELSAETFDPDLDMNMFGDLGAGFIDPLGDASMDSFTDLTALLAGVSCCLLFGLICPCNFARI